MFRQGGRSEVKRHADLHRSIARTPQVLHLMPAVAHPYADVRRRVDHMRGALVVEPGHQHRGLGAFGRGLGTHDGHRCQVVAQQRLTARQA